MELLVQEAHTGTIQGEGHWTGTLVDFIRLYGCPVGCWYCDQEYADGGVHLAKNKRSIEDLVAELKSPRVVISGGEPMIHKHLPDLCEAIIQSVKKPHIETSGAAWQDIPLQCWVTLSPKAHLNPNYPVKPEAWDRCNEIKIVISGGNEIDFYQEQLDRYRGKQPVYLQPEWEGIEFTLPLTLELIKQNPSYKLSAQMHKYIGVY